MKVTRFQSGYRIQLSDSEFIALREVFLRGRGEFEDLADHEWDDLEPGVERGLKTIAVDGSWQVDDRRRAK